MSLATEMRIMVYGAEVKSTITDSYKFGCFWTKEPSGLYFRVVQKQNQAQQ